MPLEHLAEYTDQLTRVFEKHGTRGTWYAHASVGCLHVRPVLDMRARRRAQDARDRRGGVRAREANTRARTRASTATASCARSGSSRCFGPRLARAFGEIKRAFDPKGLMNPGQDRARRRSMDDRSLFRFKPGYRTRRSTTALDWSEHEVGERTAARLRGGRRDVQQQRPLPQVRRGHDVPVVSRHGRRAARHARPRQHAAARAFGPARRRRARFTTRCTTRSTLCVSCKGCKRECPTGVDMAQHEDRVPAPLPQAHGRARCTTGSSPTCRATRAAAARSRR